MLTPQEIYRAWIPDGSVWSRYAIPVLFGQMREVAKQPLPSIPNLDWAATLGQGTGLILDLPGGESVVAATELAGRGYRPVPLFAGCTEFFEVVDQRQILLALASGAEVLANLKPRPGEPPVFLLDSLRLQGTLLPGIFDNRWTLFPADLPTAKVLLAEGIRQLIWVHRGPEEPDITRLLRLWHKGGLEILHLDLDEPTDASPLSTEKSLFRLWVESKAKANQLKGPKNQGFGGHISHVSVKLPTFDWPRWSSHG